MSEPSYPQRSEPVGAGALDRVQQELDAVRSTLSTEAAQIGQLQEALEAALRVAREVRLETLAALDRLLGQLVEAARQEAATLRARAEEEAEAIRAAARAEAAALRATAEQRVAAVQAELDRLAQALASATEALARARQQLTVAAGEAPGPSSQADAGGPGPEKGGPPAVEVLPGLGGRPVGMAEAPWPPGLVPVRAEEPATRERPPAGPVPAAASALLEQAEQQLREGRVSAALDSLRAIIDQAPEQAGLVITRLTPLFRDPAYHAHQEQIRLALVDAYMMQGDYDRAMSLLHDPLERE
jgi:tetratricopeptide (TPR) repeat protein